MPGADRRIAKPAYVAYLVRVWHGGADGRRRASLREVGQDEERHFDSLVDLYVFLDRQDQAGGGGEVAEP